VPDEDSTSYTTGERVAGLIGLALVGLLFAVCLDLATGGRLASLLSREDSAPADE
jgi:hypothetical protein